MRNIEKRRDWKRRRERTTTTMIRRSRCRSRIACRRASTHVCRPNHAPHRAAPIVDRALLITRVLFLFLSSASSTAGTEMASMDVALSSSNRGYRLLKLMGWQDNTPLGAKSGGIIEPIRIDLKDDYWGLGRREIEEHYTDADNIKRPALESELEDTEERRLKRQEQAEKEAQLKTELHEIHRPLYCELCNKQYKKAVEMEAHLSSYDHHHKKVSSNRCCSNSHPSIVRSFVRSFVRQSRKSLFCSPVDREANSLTRVSDCLKQNKWKGPVRRSSTRPRSASKTKKMSVCMLLQQRRQRQRQRQPRLQAHYPLRMTLIPCCMRVYLWLLTGDGWRTEPSLQRKALQVQHLHCCQPRIVPHCHSASRNQRWYAPNIQHRYGQRRLVCCRLLTSFIVQGTKRKGLPLFGAPKKPKT